MKIWIDADASPGAVKDIVLRAAQRLNLAVTLVANRPLRVPQLPQVSMVCVPGGIDAADQYIVAHLAAGDLVITADIPLAAQVLQKGGLALNPRGEQYTNANIAERLAVRNFLDELRASGPVKGGPAAYSNQDKHHFAAALDRLLAKRPA